MENIKVLTKEDIIEKLKNMRVSENGVAPMKFFSFIVINPDYNPEEFSEEIEKSEEKINELDEVCKEMKKPEFDWVWNNTLHNLPRNSDKWHDNHTKNCPHKVLFNKISATCVVHEDGTRDYYSEEILERVMKIENIVDFC